MKTFVPVVFTALLFIGCDQILLSPPEETSLDLTTALAPAADAPVSSTTASTAETVSGFTIGGTSTGGWAPSLVLQNNGGDDLTLSSSGSFTFATPLQTGATYNITVLSNPPSFSCTPTSNTGTVSGANVTNVIVTCTGA